MNQKAENYLYLFDIVIRSSNKLKAQFTSLWKKKLFH